MAYDKVVDSAVLNANLTTVADAIRAKGGTSDPLSFPTGFADAIAAIQAGGGGDAGGGEESFLGYYCKTGSFTPSEKVSLGGFSLEIPCNDWTEKVGGSIYSSEICFLLVREYIEQTSDHGFFADLTIPAKKNYVNHFIARAIWNNSMSTVGTSVKFSSTISFDKNKDIITYSMSETDPSAANYFLAGVTYRYICAAFNDSLKVGG